MPHRYDEFVHLENIRNFQKKLEVEADPLKRDLLARLLAAKMVKKMPVTDNDNGSHL